jgi:hypothetical protein
MAEGAEEDAFVERLLAIVAKREATGLAGDDPYGQSDDGIDTWHGFGRDIWVESLQVVDGEYGAELEVTVGLAVPSDEAHRVPARTVARVPFERTWRQLSGYTSPAEYAPYVAREVERAATLHVQRHRGAPRSSTGRESARWLVPARDVQWRLLLDGLAAEGGPTVEVSPGRIEVRIADSDGCVEAGSPVVTVILTADQWEDVLMERGSGQVDMYVAELLGPRDSDELFVVFYRGDLVRSIREELPPVRGRARARRFAAQGPGGWFTAARPRPQPHP